MFPYAPHSFCAAKNEVFHHDWMKFHHAVMEMRDAKLVKCFTEEGIATDEGEEI